MPLDAQYLSCFPHAIDVLPKTGEDRYGKKSVGTAVNLPQVRIKRERTTVRGADGEDVTAELEVWVPGEPDVAPDTHVVQVPGDLDRDGGTQNYEVIVRQVYPDEAGPHHIKLFLGLGG